MAQWTPFDWVLLWSSGHSFGGCLLEGLLNFFAFTAFSDVYLSHLRDPLLETKMEFLPSFEVRLSLLLTMFCAAMINC